MKTSKTINFEMRRITIFCFTVFCILLFSPAPHAVAQMTDDAVVQYVKTGVANGKSQDQIVKELLAKGVTKEQALRIQQAMQGKGTTGAVRDAGVQERVRRMNGTMSGIGEASLGEISDQLTAMPDTLFRQGKVKVIERNGQKYLLQEDIDSTALQVFGHNIFTNKDLTFAPNENIATPENYRLGPGDEVIIDIWGTNQNTIRQTISPDGFINVENVGILYLGGMSVKEADRYVRKQLNSIYSIDGEDAQSDIKITLGALRTIQVNVMGEVKVPGTYFLSSLSSVYHALYRAGGFTELGSLRNIELIRNGKSLAEIDIYDFIINGRTGTDITLQDGDIVLVPTYEMIVDIAGNVKRPMKYELKDGESAEDAIGFAGGFKGDAYTGNVNIVRRNGREYQVYTVAEQEYPTFRMMDADSLTVGAILDRYENRLEVKGAVYRPGVYQLSDNVNTVSSLIAIADGIRGDAFTNRAIIHREREDYTLETIALDLAGILNGTSPDIPLQENDVLYVSSIHDLNDLGSITVKGEVARPGSFVFARNMTVEDAIMQAGGLLESASLAKIDVSRRIKDPHSNELSDTLSRVYTFAISEGFEIGEDGGFILQPYDQIYVRKSPKYMRAKEVEISGEVVFPGQYTLANRDERLSDLVRNAGGVNQWAYVKGARLSRRMNDDERARLRATMNVLDSRRDSINVSQIETAEQYYVGIDLEKAMKNPGSNADIVLREGDILDIPAYINTVKISGNVMYPNTVTYNEGMRVRDYVRMAGGYGYKSKRYKAYVIYMNGTVDRARQMSRKVVEPGCEIVIPMKDTKEGQLEKFLSIATTSSSIATMLATITNLIK